MLWVGGSIVVHGANELGWPWPYETIKSMGYVTSGGGAYGFVQWLTVAALDATVGLVIGLLLLPLVESLLVRFTVLFPEKSEVA